MIDWIDTFIRPLNVHGFRYIHTESLRGSRGDFKVISQLTLSKADIYRVGAAPPQRWGMDTARILEIEDQPVSSAAPEDVIIRKLEFYREGNSQKHLRDIASILSESSSEIDQ